MVLLFNYLCVDNKFVWLKHTISPPYKVVNGQSNGNEADQSIIASKTQNEQIPNVSLDSSSGDGLSEESKSIEKTQPEGGLSEISEAKVEATLAEKNQKGNNGIALRAIACKSLSLLPRF